MAATQTPERVMAVEAARRYFLHDESKQDIARAIGVSRFKVARLIDQARADGLVRISIAWPGEIDEVRSQRLSARLGVDVRVAATATSPSGDGLLGAVCVDAVREVLPERGTIGISWGRAVRSFVTAAENLPAADVVQLIGGLGVDASEMSGDSLARSLAQRLGSRAYVMQAPLAVQSAAIAAALRAEPNLQQTLDESVSVDVAVVGIGAWPTDVLSTFMTEDEKQALQSAGAVADICGRSMNGRGELLATTFDDRLIAIDAERLRAYPRVIAIATGHAKVPAIEAACASGIVDVLVTDAATADELENYAVA